MSDTYYLYLKIHNITGLQYLGSTRQDPFNYIGSGKYWKNHIKTYGNNVTTKILLKTQSKQELKETGIFFSSLWDIVNSKDFANLVEEMGQGGAIAYGPNNGMWKIGTKHPLYGKALSEETKKKISLALSNPSKETRELIAKSRRGKQLSPSTKEKLSQLTKAIPKTKVECPYCKKIGGKPVMMRFHFDNCKARL